ncbi:MAG TPA: hypothetical protein VFV47_03525, partial [Hyphomicrobiaceae bacterium]|nr:hypothetical protein [Hyphomicrobiaceae bacterium]
MPKAIVEHTSEDLKHRFGWQTPVMLLLIVVVAFLVLLPILFLVEKAFNVGDPMSFPANQHGTGNLLSLFVEDYDIILNTIY